MGEFTKLQQETLDFFAKSAIRDKFYWTGGTLLSVVYLRHRRSQDIDFFSDAPFSHEEIIGFVNDLKQQLTLEFIEEKKIYDRWEFFLHNSDDMRLEFVHYDHPRLKPRADWNGIKIDSLDDIAANKLMAMFDRNEPKDVFDVYFLLTKAGYSSQKLLELVAKKFGVHLDESSIWSESFKCAKDLENLRPLMLENESEQAKILEDIKTYFINHSNQFLNRVLE